MLNVQESPRVQAVRLITDERSLREQYRYAFADHFTVIQELMQNARRAGATRVVVTYDPGEACLTVTDDGIGIDDFQILVTFAGSNWTEEIARTERPFGFGFASALYVADKVQVESRGRMLAFDTDRLLAGEEFPPTDGTTYTGTKITLFGVDLKTPESTMRSIVQGFPIPVNYNGLELARPDAIDVGGFVSTPVGLVLPDYKFHDSGVVVYLQGFQVYRGHPSYRTDVVHLDGAIFRGKWPDRDRCIDQDLMIEAVSKATRGVHESRLAAMKAALSPIVFCEQAYVLAQSLERLDIFNDIDVVPGSWLGVLNSMPHTLHDGDGFSLDPLALPVSREELEAGDRHLCPLLTSEGGFGALEYSEDDEEAGADQLIWVHAFAARALVLSQRLHHDHWIVKAAASSRTALPKLEYTVLHDALIPETRTQWIGDTRLLLTTLPTLEVDGLTVTIRQAFATIVDGRTTIVVPCTTDDIGSTSAAYVTEACLRQCRSYIDGNEVLDEQALNIDEREANQLVRQLLAKSPRDHLQSVLDAALSDYRAELKRYSVITIEVDAAGNTKVLDLAEAAAFQ